MNNKGYPLLCDDLHCTGCMACANSCQHSALSFSTNKEGFYRPSLNRDKCVMCGLCEKACPVVHPITIKKEDIQVFAAWHRDESIRRQSSSGGAFTALADAVLRNKGVVFGAAFSDSMLVEHIGITEVKDLPKLRLSKYVQSRIGESFHQVKDYLVSGKNVMFVGTPCQVAGLRTFLQKDYDKLLLVDFICHGVPSKDALSFYLTWLDKKYGKIKHINFRDKRKGWYDSLRVIKDDDGNETVLKGRQDSFFIAFNKNNNLQECCYNCPMLGFPRLSDITLADFWRIGTKVPFNHKAEIANGISLIVVNSPKASSVLSEASKDLIIENRSIDEALAGNSAAFQSCIRPDSRATFYEDLHRMDYVSFCSKYMKQTRKNRVMQLAREFLPSGLLKRIRGLKQK